MFRSIPERPYTYRKQMPNTDLTLELTNDRILRFKIDIGNRAIPLIMIRPINT